MPAARHARRCAPGTQHCRMCAQCCWALRESLTTVTKLTTLNGCTPFNMELLMKRTLVAAAGFALFAASGLADAASWSVFVEPGIYGRVAIGGYADPPVV